MGEQHLYVAFDGVAAGRAHLILTLFLVGLFFLSTIRPIAGARRSSGVFTPTCCCAFIITSATSLTNTFERVSHGRWERDVTRVPCAHEPSGLPRQTLRFTTFSPRLTRVSHYILWVLDTCDLHRTCQEKNLHLEKQASPVASCGGTRASGVAPIYRTYVHASDGRIKS